MSVIPDASGVSLKAFTTNNIERGSTVITDGWAGYTFVSSEGYQHTAIPKKHATSEDKTLPHVHMVISLLKRWLLGTHQGAVREKHLQSYLDEYVFRFNRRKAAARGLLFYRLLECAMNVQTVTYDELVKPKP